MNMDGKNSCRPTWENSSECEVYTTEGVGYTLLFLLGLVLNVAAVVVFMVRRSSWTDTHIYLINLTVADLALILYLPFRIYDAFYCLEVSWLCTFLMSVHYVNMYASILTSTAISVHRFLVVRFPLQARSWRKKKQAAFTVCLAIWAVVVTLSVVYRKTADPSELQTCFEICENKPFEDSFLALLLTVGYLAPLLVIVFCSSQIIWIIKKEECASAEKKNIVSIVTANMIIFIVCYTPFHFGLLLHKFKPTAANIMWRGHPIHTYLLAAEWVATTNCCLDSISYYFLLKGFYVRVDEPVKREAFTES